MVPDLKFAEESNFDSPETPFLLLFTISAENHIFQCHIIKVRFM